MSNNREYHYKYTIGQPPPIAKENHEKFYVCRIIPKHTKDYHGQTFPYDRTQYLHKDYRWRNSTKNEQNEYTGYYDTLQEAQQSLLHSFTQVSYNGICNTFTLPAQWINSENSSSNESITEKSCQNEQEPTPLS